MDSYQSIFLQLPFWTQVHFPKFTVSLHVTRFIPFCCYTSQACSCSSIYRWGASKFSPLLFVGNARVSWYTRARISLRYIPRSRISGHRVCVSIFSFTRRLQIVFRSSQFLAHKHCIEFRWSTRPPALDTVSTFHRG